MKTTYKAILVLALGAVVLLASSLPCAGAERGDEFAWPEGRPEHRFERAHERVERIMSRLAESDPEKAEELEELREKDPEQFRAELRKLMRKQFGRRFREHREHMEGRGDREFGRHKRGSGWPRKKMTRERQQEYFEWLKKNYAGEAEKLVELRRDKPELYRRQLALSQEKYGRIMRVSEKHPELAESLKEDLELKEKRDGLLKEIRAAGDDKKKELMERLERVVSNRFDLIVKRKQIRYEYMRRKIERMQKHIQQSQSEVEKWQSPEFKGKNVKARVEELLSKTEKFDWE